MDYNEEQIEKIIKELPDSVRKVVQSKDLITTIQEIGADHELYVWQIGVLEHECLLTLVGLHKSYDFVRNLKAKLEIDTELAEKLKEEINKKIFMVIRQTMSSMPRTYENEEEVSKESILNEIENPTEHITEKVTPEDIPDLSITQNTDETAVEEPAVEIKEKDPLDLPWDHKQVTISSKLLDDKLTEIVKLSKEHVDIKIDVDAMEKAEEMHEKEAEEKRNSYIEWQEKQKQIAVEREAAKTAAQNAVAKPVDSISTKKIPPLRVRKQYEEDPYREPTE